MSKRVAIYARVSTARQAAHDISIPDQLREARAYCRKRGWEIAREYVEPGASARDDKRPEFRRLIDDACTDHSPYDIVLVHSLSRFFRDAIEQGLHKRKLEKYGVLLLSVTQDFGQGPQADLIQTVVAACDAHQSAETSKHVKRAMKENARLGFWNGSRPPLGYKTTVAEVRGEKEKKELAIDPKGAEIVKLIFRLNVEGDGDCGPIGVKRIAEYLNARSYKTASGGAFYTSQVHAILTRTTYMGVHYYNQNDSRTRKARPREEWIEVKTPIIIPPETFALVQSRLTERRPHKTAPRRSNNPVLLSGIAHCRECGSPLMLTTGKSGRYRYYTCAGKNLKGKTACAKPTRIPEAKLNEIVTDAVAERVLAPERLKPLLAETLKHSKANNQSALSDLKLLRREVRDIETKIERLFDALTDGLVNDRAAFKAQLAKLQGRKDEVIRLVSTKERAIGLPAASLSNRQIDQFSNGLRELIQNGPAAFRKEYLGMVLSRVDVSDDEVRISGSKAVLAAAASAKKAGEPVVPSFVPEWCTRQDSNL